MKDRFCPRCQVALDLHPTPIDVGVEADEFDCELAQDKAGFIGKVLTTITGAKK